MSLINYPKTLGIITEYNPFHNGHLHHLEASKAKTDAELVIAIMSGHFTQRGEPAIADPWTRATWAIQSGVDLVIELPTLFATSSAAYFAHGSVFLLDALQGVDALCFGSETGQIEPLVSLAEHLLSEEDNLSEASKENPAESFSRIRTNFLKAGQAQSNLTQSNDILGVNYIQALSRIDSSIVPHTIKRISAAYHSESIESSIASATAIRKAHLSDETALIGTAVPPQTLHLFEQEINKIPNMSLWQEWILMMLRRSSPEALLHIHDMADGLAQRLINHATAPNYESFEESVQTKIYTRGRIKRSLCKMILSIEKKDLLNDCQTNPQYLRVLGFNEKGRAFLNRAKPTLPLITNPKHFRPLTEEAKNQWALDLRAANLYALLLKEPLRAGGKFMRTSPVYLRE